MTERIHVACSFCKKRLAVPATVVGKRIKCPACLGVISVPRLASSQSASESKLATAGDSKTARRPAGGRSSNGDRPARPKPADRSRPKKRTQRESRADSQPQRKRRPEGGRSDRKRETSPVTDNWIDDDYDEELAFPSAPLPSRQRKKKKKSSKPRLLGTGNEPQPSQRAAGVSVGTRLFNSGTIGGIGMMLGAIVWLVVGLMAGVLFYYPPVLFLIGLFSFVKGLIHGE